MAWWRDDLLRSKPIFAEQEKGPRSLEGLGITGAPPVSRTRHQRIMSPLGTMSF